MSDVTTSASAIAPNNSNYVIKNKDLEVVVTNVLRTIRKCGLSQRKTKMVATIQKCIPHF